MAWTTADIERYAASEGSQLDDLVALQRNLDAARVAVSSAVAASPSITLELYESPNGEKSFGITPDTTECYLLARGRPESRAGTEGHLLFAALWSHVVELRAAHLSDRRGDWTIAQYYTNCKCPLRALGTGALEPVSLVLLAQQPRESITHIEGVGNRRTEIIKGMAGQLLNDVLG